MSTTLHAQDRSTVEYACAVRVYPRPRWTRLERIWALAYSTACTVAIGWPVSAYIVRQVSG